MPTGRDGSHYDATQSRPADSLFELRLQQRKQDLQSAVCELIAPLACLSNRSPTGREFRPRSTKRGSVTSQGLIPGRRTQVLSKVCSERDEQKAVEAITKVG